MTTDFTCTTLLTAAGPVLGFAGELDADVAPEALEAIGALTLEKGQQLVVDLGELAFCDSSGVAVLIAARNHALAADAGIALAAVPPQLSRTLDLVGLTGFFTMYASTADARAAWES
ncbi:STAS domain-containing protein [Amycolatopsis sp. cg5]|uniref:STAS domain-containing protein n=1 Tax=Amycolatopsis sp. cg5 TaxID=3238802 RepID=UPI0035263CEB